MAAEKPKAEAKAPEAKQGTTYELVEAPDCGEQFVALVKTVPRSNGDKVKRLVFNRNDIPAVQAAMAKKPRKI